MKIKKVSGIIIMVVLLQLLTIVSIFADPVLTKQKITLSVNNAYVLTLNGSSQTVAWSSSKKNIVSIVFSNNERAVLKAKKTGTSTITAQIGNKKLTCKVTVKKQKGIPKKMTVIKGDKVTFKQNKKKGTWKSSNTAIAKVAKKKSASKKVTFKALGTVVISEKIGKKTYKCKVTVISKYGTNSDVPPAENSNPQKSDKDPSKTTETKVVEAKTEEAYGSAVSDLMKQYSSTISASNTDPYATKTLIVKCTSKADLSSYGAVKIIEGPDYRYLVQFDSAEAAKQAEEKIKNLGNIEYVEPDQYCYSLTDVYDDYVKNNAFGSWGSEYIYIQDYRGYIYRKSLNKRKVVAIIDTGVSSHSFLSGYLTGGGFNYVNYRSDPTDDQGHGTHVAGTVVDCAYGLPVKLISVKVLDNNGVGSSSAIASGIRFATNYGVDVINLSLRHTKSSEIDNAVKQAIKKGIVVVAAAGNDNSDTSKYSPQHLNDVIVVSAIEGNDIRPDFSNYGSTVDVCAPGIGIMSCDYQGGYTGKDGTSQAAPHVSALAALYLMENPSASPAQVESWIKSKTRDLGTAGWDKYYGQGVIDLSGTKFRLSETSLSMKPGDTHKLTVDYDGYCKVEWSTLNTSTISLESTNDNGVVVKALSSGDAVLTGTAGDLIVRCNVSVASQDATADPFTFGTVGDHAFFLGQDKATVSFVLDNESSNVELSISDSKGTLVISKLYSSCNANESYDFIWDGKNSDGQLVSPGQYNAKIKAGNITSISNGLTLFLNPFEGGVGTEADPFQVKTFEQLKHMSEFPDAYYVQTQDIDCGNSAIQNALLGNNGFKGQYDGKNFSIQNLNAAANSIFGNIEEEGVIKNVILENIYVRGGGSGGICFNNSGTIESCKLIQFKLETTVRNGSGYNGGICHYNYGKITHCVVQDGTIDYNGGGFASSNEENGLIEYSEVKNVVFTEIEGYPNSGHTDTGGFCFFNFGTIDHCVATSLSHCEYSYVRDNRSGGVISNCSYSDIDGFYDTALVKQGIIY